ncbi:MAG: PorT family protein [Bacteroidales bacterium]|nr:PorT family protein [Bacteroidales bacterium]
MKKSILSIFLISFFIIGYAQKFNGGAMIGMAASQVAGDRYSGFNKAGPIAGFFVNFQPAEHSSFQFELSYVQKGSKKNANYAKGDDTSYLLRLNYVEMPLLYKFHFGRFAIEAGPSLAFFMGGYEEKNGEDVKADDFAPITFQLNLGVVFNITENWMVGIRTNNSFTNLRNKTHTGHVYRLGSHGQFNDVLMLCLVYQFFHFGK